MSKRIIGENPGPRLNDDEHPEWHGIEIDAEGDAWGDLGKAVVLFASKPNTNSTSPFHCEHDTLHVMAEPGDFTTQEIAQLDEWGFNVDSDLDNFYSFRYGSA